MQIMALEDSMGSMMAPASALLADSADMAFATEMTMHHQVCTPTIVPKDLV